MMRAVIYARYSSELQRQASIEDQLEVCRRFATAQGWSVVDTYTDAAISGASRFRPGFQSLLAHAGHRRFEVVICEAIDRLGRRLADTADLQDQLSFHGVRLFTPAMGELTQIHVAVIGMMSQMALKDLGEKTKRGQLGRVLKGRVAGGLAYGYRVDRSSDGGARAIEPAEAANIQIIFREYAAGRSPEAIAKELNRKNIKGPGGRPWSNTTIRGQRDRGTGILNNALYRGVLEWNRCSYVKDPRTGKRVARPNPPDRWEVQSVPALRIVDDELWERAKVRQDSVRPSHAAAGAPAGTGCRLNSTHRPRFLLSGLLRCGSCGGGFTVVGKDRYGCATRRQKGTCTNARTVTRHAMEGRVLVGLKDRLLAPDLVAEAVAAAQEELQRSRRGRQADVLGRERTSAEIERKIAAIMRAIEDGFYEPAMKQRMIALRAQKDALAQHGPADAEPHLDIGYHPRIPELYRRKVEQLEQLLDGADHAQAIDLIRSMIERVELHQPRQGGGLDATLFGDLAGILSACVVDKRKLPGPFGHAGSLLSVVAGTGFEPVTFRL